MSESLEQFHRRIIRGDRGAMLSLARCELAFAELVYAAVTSLRNLAFDVGLFKSRAVDRPVVSVGNITTGGTGKTPVVRWLCDRLTTAGHQPAVLLRGYHGGDEQRMLQAALPTVRVEANSKRVAGAAAALAADADISCFVLDDGFQHRWIDRDLNLVLIDATNPFGFDHVLPRGLLREPLRGLKRAHAFLITHCEAESEQLLGTLTERLRKLNPEAPIFRAEHHTCLPTHDHPIFGFCGIGNPTAFEHQLGERLVGFRAFADHHPYTVDDIISLHGDARSAGAAALVTTEKDWVKITSLPAVADALPIERAGLALVFRDNDERELLTFILERVTARMVSLANDR